VNDLSEQINALKPHYSDRQGVRTNLRLLGSLFDLKTHKRAVINPDAETYEMNISSEKYIIEIGKRLNFREVLHRLGFNEKEANDYIEYLEYQIDLDLEANRRFLAEKEQKSMQSAKHENHVFRDKIDKHDIFDKNGKDLGYPAFWD